MRFIIERHYADLVRVRCLYSRLYKIEVFWLCHYNPWLAVYHTGLAGRLFNLRAQLGPTPFSAYAISSRFQRKFAEVTTPEA